ncbi:MAG: hypothetical protein KAX42_06850 [Sphaerotilus sp.]|nr:hypothetical protein [Sphaerotilus sp.]
MHIWHFNPPLLPGQHETREPLPIAADQLAQQQPMEQDGDQQRAIE